MEGCFSSVPVVFEREARVECSYSNGIIANELAIRDGVRVGVRILPITSVR